MDVIQFIPVKLRELPLWKSIIPLVQGIVDEREEDFRSFLNKFSDFSGLDSEALQAIIQEFGYDYIIDVLSLKGEDLRSIVGFLSLIHFLKGHRVGLELILNLLKLQAVITEWWELPVNEQIPYTFRMEVVITPELEGDILLRLSDFVRQYVYPVMNLHVETTLVFDLGIAIKWNFKYSEQSVGQMSNAMFLWRSIRGSYKITEFFELDNFA